jgi:iron complex transport system ATP-binding protein
LTVVIAAHDLTLAGRYSERLLLLSGGQVVADGKPAEVLTEANLVAHYGAGVRVLADRDGPVVVPVRRDSHGPSDPTN